MRVEYLILAAVSGYLVGSISFGYILVKLKYGIDIRTVGEKVVGGTNVMKNFGKPLGVFSGLLDLLKGFFIVFFWMKVTGNQPAAILSGLCAIFGHVFPLFLQFRGGRGLATFIGSFLYFLFKEFIIILLIWGVLSFLIKRVYFSGTIALSTLPIFAIYFQQNPFVIFCTFVMIALRWVAQIKYLKAPELSRATRSQ